jgi:hypothetical protein
MKYILKQIDDISGHDAVTTIEFNTDTLDDVLQHVDLFIRGCGFFPPQGANLDYIEDQFPDWVGQQDSEWHTEEFDTSVMDGHEGMGSTLADYELYDSTDVMSTKSKHYFDTERNK